MIVIGLGGAHSSIGKTTLIVKILGLLKGNPINPSSPLGCKTWGALKYTRSNIYCALSEDPEIIAMEDKDTARMLRAGAEKVLWVQSPPERLGEVLPMAMDSLSHLSGVVVEGNSAVEFLNPDIVVFLNSLEKKDYKPSASRLLQKADIIIHKGNSETLPNIKDKPIITCLDIETLNIKELITLMEETIIAKRIQEELAEKAKEGRITCHEARMIAESLGVPYGIVGKKADEMKIKIKNCELGCF